MRLTRLLCLASALLCLPMCAAPAVAQTGQYQANPRTLTNGERNDLLLDANGRLVTTAGTGTSAPQEQGTAANGSTATGNPNVVAGTDSSGIVRTLRTDTSGGLVLNSSSAFVTALGNVASAATDSGNPIKIGGFASSTAPTAVANGQRVNGWFGLYGQQFGQLVDGNGVPILTINPQADYSITNITPLLGTYAQQAYFDGGSSIRARGDINGAFVQEKERSVYFSDFSNALAASASIGFLTRDGGLSPSQWGTFSCWARSDQASSTGGFALQGSNDGTNWVQFQTASVAANSPTRLTERNDMRYHRCLFVNGATASTLTTVTSSFGN